MELTTLAHRHSLNVATTLLSGLAIWRIGLSPELPAILAFIVGGVILAAIDWRVQRLPTRIVYSTLAGVAAGLIFASIINREWVPLVTAVAGGLLFANTFFFIWFCTTKFTGMKLLGFGDVRLAGVLGLLLGWYGLPFVLYGAIVGHLLVVMVAIAVSVNSRRIQVRYSFGPPLIAGALAVVLLHA
jgi:leader peptidase (prepilin peptidase) / N-methyltransferase